MTNLPHKLLLLHKSLLKFRQAFANNVSANIKLSKIQLSKIVQPGLPDVFLEALVNVSLPTIKNVLTPLAIRVLKPLGLTAVESAADTGICKKILVWEPSH